MSHKVSQEKWQKNKYQQNQEELGIFPTIQYFTLRSREKLEQFLMRHQNSKKKA